MLINLLDKLLGQHFVVVGDKTRQSSSGKSLGARSKVSQFDVTFPLKIGRTK